MAGFMEACANASRVLVPMLDTIIQMNIRPDESSYISSLNGNNCQFYQAVANLKTNRCLVSKVNDLQ